MSDVRFPAPLSATTQKSELSSETNGTLPKTPAGVGQLILAAMPPNTSVNLAFVKHLALRLAMLPVSLERIQQFVERQAGLIAKLNGQIADRKEASSLPEILKETMLHLEHQADPCDVLDALKESGFVEQKVANVPSTQVEPRV